MTPASRGKTWWGLGLILVLVILGGLYFSRLTPLPSGKENSKPLCYVSPNNPSYIKERPGMDSFGVALVPVYSSPTEAKRSAGPAVAPTEPKIKAWRCPMDPEIVRKTPGKCPKCGMDLMPIYEEAPAAAPAAIQSMGVRTAKVEVRPLSRDTWTVGVVNLNERSLTVINTKVNGWVERLYVNATGDPVRKGQALLSIYSPELVSSQDEYLLALKNLKSMEKSPVKDMVEGARRLAAASRRRLQLFDITPTQIADLEQTGKVKKNLTLVSPANGIVMKRMVTQGTYVNAGMPLLEVADLSTIWVDADIYQYELPWIKVGQPVEMTLDYMPGETFQGKIDYIYPYLKEATRTAKVRLRFPNPNLKLKPEMFASVKIKSPVTKPAVVVPMEAVLDTGLKQHVFIALGQGRFEPREVKLGVFSDENNYREVLSGLTGGEEVVTSAQFLLDSESRFREAIQLMMPGMESEGKKEGALPAMPEMKTGGPKQTPPPMPPGHKH